MTLATNTSVGGSSTPPPSCPTVTLSPATGGTVGVAFNQTIAGSGGAVAVHLHYHQRYPARGLYAHRVRRAGVDADHRGIVHL
jgi:hypothetical protein